MQAFEEASGRKVKYEVKPRRPGDAAAVWAATETAEKVQSLPTRRLSFSLLAPSGTWHAMPAAHGFSGQVLVRTV